MPRKHLSIILAVLIGVVGYSLAASVLRPSVIPAEAKTIGRGDFTFDDLLTRFRDVAREKGGVYAFDVLRYAELPPSTDLHLIGHEIGNELYSQEGIEGMQYCTHEFRNACSHSIVIGYMQENGDGKDVKRAIDEACKKAPGGPGAYGMCYHGLGHGVFAYYGYTFPKTVEFCESAGTEDRGFIQRNECIGGAIMELVGGGGHDPEKWEAANRNYFSMKDPLAPCNTKNIPKDSKPSCYVYITPHLMAWANASFQNFTPDQMRKAMSACDTLPVGTRDRESCVRGFGKDIAAGVVGQSDSRKLTLGTYTDREFQAVEDLCSLEDTEDDKHDCELSALGTFFWGGEAEKNLAPRYCRSLDDEPSRDVCFSDLAMQIGFYMHNPEMREARCSMIDEKYRSACAVR